MGAKVRVEPEAEDGEGIESRVERSKGEGARGKVHVWTSRSLQLQRSLHGVKWVLGPDER